MSNNIIILFLCLNGPFEFQFRTRKKKKHTQHKNELIRVPSMCGKNLFCLSMKMRNKMVQKTNFAISQM